MATPAQLAAEFSDRLLDEELKAERRIADVVHEVDVRSRLITVRGTPALDDRWWQGFRKLAGLAVTPMSGAAGDLIWLGVHAAVESCRLEVSAAIGRKSVRFRSYDPHDLVEQAKIQVTESIAKVVARSVEECRRQLLLGLRNDEDTVDQLSRLFSEHPKLPLAKNRGVWFSVTSGVVANMRWVLFGALNMARTDVMRSVADG